jgi:hypothetical protein
MDAISELQHRLNELIDDLGEALDHTLPEDHRRPNESGEEAYLREIHNPLNWIDQILYSIE